MTPEEKARLSIDKKLQLAGYIIQDMNDCNPSASLGVVVREFPTNSGPVDYLIFINKIPVGVIEAKATNKAESLTSVAEQSKRYAESGLKFTKDKINIRFAYEATDIITHFYDHNDAKARSREVFTFHKPELREFLLNARKAHDQIIDTINLDTVTFKGWDSDHENKAEETIRTFRNFIDENKDKITALSIIYNQSYQNRQLTFQMIEELYEELSKPPYNLSNTKLWTAYEIKDPQKIKKRIEDKLADIISLVRFELGQTQELNLFSAEVNLRFQTWIFKKNAGYGQFTDEQTDWLRIIRDHIAISAHGSVEDLDYTPFDAKGGLSKFYQLFGEDYKQILTEINYALVA